MMNIVEAISLTSAVNSWLTKTRQPRVLHIFDRACNLINERREILSIVTPEIGDGPFNLVVETDTQFAEQLSLESPVSNSATQLHLGDINILTTEAKLWNPRPDWELLLSKRNAIAAHLFKLPVIAKHPSGTNYSASILQSSNSLAVSLANADHPSSLDAAKGLAGLGQGLTPSGDDLLMGALYAVWIIHPQEVASGLAQGVAESAAPLTTSLSAAWLRSAGRGEAGIRWHEMLAAFLAGNAGPINRSIEKILATGETSGADALAGFAAVFSQAG